MDRAARDGAAAALRAFIGGRISNDAFADAQPRTADPAIPAIWESAWVFTDDMRSHKLTGRFRLPPEQRRACARWVLFLDSDLPYLWPDFPMPGIDPHGRIASGWRGWLNPFRVPAPAVARFMRAGHYPVWPFLTAADYRATLRHPRRLAGAKELPDTATETRAPPV